MKKYISLLAGALIVGAFFVQPVRAETNLGSLAALIQSLMAQVQELQKQLTILQNEAGGSTATSSISIHVKNDVQYGADTNSAFIATSIGAGSQNSTAYSWKLAISCTSGATLIVPSKGDGPGQSMCGTTQTYYTYNYPGINDGITVLGAEAKNTNDSQATIVYALTAYDANGKHIGGDKDAVTLGATNNSKETIDISRPVGGERYIPGQAIPLTFEVKSSDGTPDVAIRVLQHTEGKDLVVNEAYYLYEDGFIKNGKNTLDFYPAKGSSYPTEKLAGEFRLELSVGKISCCKWWIEPTDSDITGWFKISYDKATDKDPYELSSKVLGASTSYQDVLSQMTNTLKGMQGFLQGLK